MGGNATDDGLALSSYAAGDTPQGDEATMYANRTFRNDETMRVETKSQRDLKLALNNNNLGNTFGARNLANVLIILGVKQSAKSTAQPHTRIAPLKEQPLKTLVLGVMKARREAAGQPTKNLLPGVAG